MTATGRTLKHVWVDSGARLSPRPVARVRHAVWQQEIASRIGCPRSYVSELENGRVPPPKRPVVQAFASALALTAAEQRDLHRLATSAREDVVRFDHATPHRVRLVARTLKQVQDRLLPHQAERLLTILQEGPR